MSRSSARIALALALVAGGVLAGQLMLPAGANHLPANKLVAQGSTLEVLGPEVTEEGEASMQATILTGTMRTSSTIDFVISVTAECALWTDLVLVGNDTSEAVSTVKIWVEIDGAAVPVSGDDTEETGRVVYCNRAFRQEIENLDDEDAMFKTFLATRAANAFNWVLYDVGSGIHHVEVKAILESSVVGTGRAMAAIGNRTLVLEPERAANDASI